MRKVIDYTDDTRETIITQQEAKGFRLVEDQRHFDGNHLIFDDGKLEPLPRHLAAEIDELKAEQDEIKAKLKEKGIL